jgi:hypothetical protein
MHRLATATYRGWRCLRGDPLTEANRRSTIGASGLAFRAVDKRYITRPRNVGPELKLMCLSCGLGAVVYQRGIRENC